MNRLFIKVRRDGERFWLLVEETLPHGFVAIVDNHLITDRFEIGQKMLVPKGDVLDMMVG